MDDYDDLIPGGPEAIGDADDQTTVLHFDGACEPNDRSAACVAAYGWVAEFPGGEAAQGGGVCATGAAATNNVAEYCALGFGLRFIADQARTLYAAGLPVGYTKLAIRGDSELVIKQITREYATNNERLAKLQGRVLELLAILEACGVSWDIAWVPRELNEAADALLRKAYEQYAGKKMPQRTHGKRRR